MTPTYKSGVDGMQLTSFSHVHLRHFSGHKEVMLPHDWGNASFNDELLDLVHFSVPMEPLVQIM